MPDIEKRLEAFVRIAHGILSSLAVWVRQKSCCICWEFYEPGQQRSGFTIDPHRPEREPDYFRVLDEFVVHTLGENARAITASSLMTPLKSLVR